MALSGPSYPESNNLTAHKQVLNPRIMPKTFAAGSGTLAPLTPVGKLTASGHFAIWNPGNSDGSEVIAGFTDYRDSFDLDASDEVIGLVVLEGTMRSTDVVVPSSTNEATLFTHLRAARMRELGFYFDDLTGAG